MKKKQLKDNPEMFLRHAGYGQIMDRQSDQVSYVKRYSRDHYPRIHMYVKEGQHKETREDLVMFDFHLDQKKPGYEGQNRHNAEYEGEHLEEEKRRLKSLLLPDFI